MSFLQKPRLLIGALLILGLAAVILLVFFVFGNDDSLPEDAHDQLDELIDMAGGDTTYEITLAVKVGEEGDIDLPLFPDETWCVELASDVTVHAFTRLFTEEGGSVVYSNDRYEDESVSAIVTTNRLTFEKYGGFWAVTNREDSCSE